MSKPIRRDRDSNGNLKPYNRCRKWELQVSITRDGKSRKRSKRYNDHTYREAKDELARFKVQVESEIPKSGWSCSKWFEQYAKRKGKTVTESTIANFNRASTLFVEIVGDKAIEDVTADDVSKWRDSLLVEYSPKTVNNRMVLVRPAFDDAVRRDILPRNPFFGVELPRVPKKERKALTDEQVASLTQSLDPTNGLHLAILLCLKCGLRRGEVCALTWDCLEDDVLTIKKSVNDRGKVGPTKNGKVRMVPVPPSIMEAINSMERDCDYICSRGGGLSIHPHYLYKWWDRNQKSFGLEDIRLHDLRHTYATELVRKGVNPRVVQELLGHQSIDTTMQIYTHVDMEQRRKAAARIG